MKDHNAKRYKLINSKTGNAIFYHTIHGDNHDHEKIKEELEHIRAQVAIQNNVFLETLYWEEEKED